MKGSIPMFAALAVSSAMLALAQVPVTQPPEPVDPSPINGETYYLINQLSGLQVDLNDNSRPKDDSVVQNARSFSSLSQRWAMTKLTNGNWKISNIASGLCLDGESAFFEAAVTIVQKPCGIDVPTQEWSLTYTTNGYNTIKNIGTRRVLDASSPSAGAKLILSSSFDAPRQSQQWLLRPAYWRGNDMSTAVKEEYDRVAQNPTNLPWWHDAYLPGQDMLQIFKNGGMNAIRLRPASISTTVVHGSVSFSLSNGPYNNYTLPAGTSTTFPATAVNQIVPVTTDGGSGNYAQTDWSAVDLAKRAKELGMAVFICLFYDGYNTSDTPGLWAGKTIAEIAGVPPTPGLMYKYVKQEIELFRANGAMPDMVGIGNEVNDGMFNTTGSGGLLPAGTNATPNTAGTPNASFANFAAIQKAAMQAIVDAAADPDLGPPLPPPLRCIDIDGGPDLQTFFTTATQFYEIPVENICQSYYPGWHGPLTQAQFSWNDCGAGGDPSCNPAVGQHVEEANVSTETTGLEIPVFTAEDGVEYTPGGSPTDDWYGSELTPYDGSRAHERQFFIDLNKVQKNAPNNLGMGMDCWACEASAITGVRGVYEYWVDAPLGLFDASTTPGSALDNAVLPSMLALGGKVDPTLTYKLVNAGNGRILETADVTLFQSPQAHSAPLRTGVDTGVTGLRQQWQILSQGGDPEVNEAIYPTPMDHLGDGYFQIINMEQRHGVHVLDASGGTTPDTPVVGNIQTAAATAITGTNASQEWDIITAGNCGDIPANCTSPPLTATGDYYMIVNKASGLVLAADPKGPDAVIQQQTPAAASNGDWMVPANKGQLWQIYPVHITAVASNRP